MAWSGGAFSRTNGFNTGSTVWAQDEAGAVDIESSRHDTHDQDLADGINACLNKAGQNAMTGDLDMGGNDITNVGAIPSSVTITYTSGLVDLVDFDTALTLGAAPGGGSSMSFDGAHIQAKSDATTASTLRLNRYGGDTNIGPDSGVYTGAAVLYVDGDEAAKSVKTNSKTGLLIGATTAGVYAGTGSPESALGAPVGSLYIRTDGGTGTALYVKETGAATTVGWVAK